jgi:hypothetical protein
MTIDDEVAKQAIARDESGSRSMTNWGLALIEESGSRPRLEDLRPG